MSEPLYPHALIGTFYKPGTIDCFTLIFADRGLRCGHYTMLATRDKGCHFSQWTDRFHDPVGGNEPLGARVCITSIALVEHVRARADA